MKKIITLFTVVIFTTTISIAQIGVALDYAMWSGEMIKDSEKTSSTILGVNYTHNLGEKMNLVGSLGYGMGLNVLPMKADINYSLTEKLALNLGMGIYMISDSTYDARAIGVHEEGEDHNHDEAEEGSTNEFGINLGASYQITSSISLGFNYNMVKGGDYNFNGMQFGLVYSFGNKSAEETTEE